MASLKPYQKAIVNSIENSVKPLRYGVLEYQREDWEDAIKPRLLSDGLSVEVITEDVYLISE